MQEHVQKNPEAGGKGGGEKCYIILVEVESFFNKH